MKKIVLSFVLIFTATILLSGCKHAAKYVDDYVDDAAKYVDDVLNGSKRVRVKTPKEKRCGQCNGSGVVYDIYGYAYSCNNCGGDGKVWFN